MISAKMSRLERVVVRVFGVFCSRVGLGEGGGCGWRVGRGCR